ncbi:hypothetical protein [Gordonia sp. NPDC127522]|uniref:hypothetical protein n=1 Tax=Gordonia sp. NPDC127522 TaxID=3345390 RepID=UPI0036291229
MASDDALTGTMFGDHSLGYPSAEPMATKNGRPSSVQAADRFRRNPTNGTNRYLKR